MLRMGKCFLYLDYASAIEPEAATQRIAPLRGRRALTPALVPRHIFQYPGNISSSERLFGSRRDSLHHRQLMCRGKVAVTGGHDDRLVTRRFLNLFDRRASHRQPGTKCVPV